MPPAIDTAPEITDEMSHDRTPMLLAFIGRPIDRHPELSPCARLLLRLVGVLSLTRGQS